MIRFDVLTLFPGIFSGFLSESLLNLAIEKDLLNVYLHDIRSWASDKHLTVDDRPFGGGPGMVMKADPIVPAVEAVQNMTESPGHLILFTPQGRRFNQRLAEEFAKMDRIVLLCGRYEGFDQRVCDLLHPDELSIGDYVLNGGEVAAMAVIESVMRLIPGALGDKDSAVVDSFSEGNRLLEEAQYTRPREYRGLSVPEILLSGNHAEIAKWRQAERLERTRARRPDLLISEEKREETKE